jgi:hypothetical protein
MRTFRGIKRRRTVRGIRKPRNRKQADIERHEDEAHEA